MIKFHQERSSAAVIRRSSPDAPACGESGSIRGLPGLIRRLLFVLLTPVFAAVLFAGSPALAEDKIIGDFAPGQAPRFGPEGKQPASGFGHNLVLSAHPGVPSYLLFKFSTDKPSAVRAIVVLDGSLLVVPLRFEENLGAFRGGFPTPRAALTYQFQASFSDGATLLSETFTANPKCAEEAADKVLSAAADYPGQADLLRQAAALGREINQLQYVFESIKVIVGEGQ